MTTAKELITYLAQFPPDTPMVAEVTERHGDWNSARGLVDFNLGWIASKIAVNAIPSPVDGYVGPNAPIRGETWTWPRIWESRKRAILGDHRYNRGRRNCDGNPFTYVPPPHLEPDPPHQQILLIDIDH